MKALMRTKAGVFLVGFSVLAVWMLLAAQSVQAHSGGVSAPRCSGLPADDFFGDSETEALATDNLGGKLSPKPGTGSTGEGNTNYRYAKITIPAIAAGELRVFDSRSSAGAAVSAATLCRGGTTIKSYSKSYSNHGQSTHAGNDFANTHPDHAVFQIRAEVSPGDEEYIVVIDSEDPASQPVTIAVAFHGVIYHSGNNDTITGSFTQRGQQYDYNLKVTADGLLTVRTTGSTDTKGQLDKATSPIATDEGGGNFKIVVPVIVGDDYTVIVNGQTLDTRGSYTLDLDFKVAMARVENWAAARTTVSDSPTWTGTPFPTDDATGGTLLRLDSGDEDYFFFTIPLGSYELLTIQTQKVTGEDEDPNTKGVLFGPTGEITSDDNSGEANRHFLIETPVGPGNYVVEVTGTTQGPYELDFSNEVANKIATVPSVNSMEDDGSTALEIDAPGGSAALNDYFHALDIENAGALYVHTAGDTDTVGYLYGPDGRELADDDDSGRGNNFRIAVAVQPGLYLVLVQGKDRMTAGAYSLVVNLVEGAEVDQPTPPGTTDPPPTTVTPDPIGSLDEPPPGGVRSGIGIIRGWACQDDGNGVQIRIMNSDGDRVATFTAPYGSDRGDVDIQEHCDRRTDGIGFAVQYNYNLLAEGTYTIEAYVGRQQVGLSGGQTNTFRVVRISNEEFLRRASSGRVPVADFPRRGETTILEWDQESQNFQIVDHQ